MKIYKYDNVKNIRDSLIWWGCLCIFIAILVFINSHIITVATVSGDSMYPSMKDGDFLIVDRIHNTPSRGDVILIQVSPIKFGGKYIVKRVIATGGETVTIDYNKNEVRIDGELLSEPYINWSQNDPMKAVDGVDIVEYDIPDGCVFVMGDNRNYSSDSRDPILGMVEKPDIIGIIINK